MTQPQTSKTPASVTPAAGIAPGRIVVRRTIPATVDELFDAWLDVDSAAQWLCPGAPRRSDVSIDARVGGAYEIIMNYDSGPNRHYGEYRVIERNKRLVFTWHSAATHFTETLVTVDFHIAKDGTEVVITHERMPDHDAGLKHSMGWTKALEQLDSLLHAAHSSED